MECFSVAADGGGETEYYYTDIVRLLKVLCNCLEYLYITRMKWRKFFFSFLMGKNV